MAGLTLQIFNIPTKIVLDEFLLDATIKAVGHLDDSLNNEEYDYLNVSDVVATPWRQDNPVKPIAYPTGVLKTEDVFMVYPVETDVQEGIKRLHNFERIVFYLQHFIIHGSLSMGAEMNLQGAMEAMPRRFLVATDVSLFPMFPARAAMPEVMPIVLLNRALVSHYHTAAD